MKKYLKILPLVFLFICVSLFAVSCVGGGGTITSIEVDLDTVKTVYTVGDEVDFSEMTVTAHIEGGKTQTISASKLQIEDFSTEIPGTYTVRVKYGMLETNITMTVYAPVTSIAVTEGSYKVMCGLGEEADFDGIEVIATMSDETTRKIPFSDLTIGAYSTEQVGDIDVSIKYGTIETTARVEVRNIIDGFEMPAFVSAYQTAVGTKENKETEFMETVIYRVGDDNPFIFLPNITAWDINDAPITLTSYRSVSKVFVKEGNAWKELTGTALTDIVAIDEQNSSYDFTEAAVGGTYKLTVAPYYMPQGENFSLSFEFSVVDAWNVYSAVDLSRMDNVNENQKWNDYKTLHNVDATEINGVVLHTSLLLTDADLPQKDFFAEGETSHTEAIGTMKDFRYIYRHRCEDEQSFAFYGNGFTIDASAITPVHPTEYGNDFSNCCLFFIEGSNTDRTYSGTSSCLMQDTNFIGNAGRNNDIEETTVSLGGLIFCKFSNDNTTLRNCIIKSFFIGIFPQYNCKMEVNGCRVYDSLQDSVFVWTGVDLTLINCEMKRTGGPAVIMQHASPTEADAEKRIPTLTIDENTIIESKANGQEVWYSHAGFSTQAQQMVALSNVLEAICGGIHTASPQLMQKGKHLAENGYLNVISVLMSDGSTGSSPGVQGSVEIAGSDVANLMNNENEKLKAVKDYIGAYAPTKTLIQSSGSGTVIWLDVVLDSEGKTMVDDNGNPLQTLYILKDGEAVLFQDNVDPSFFTGDYVTIYVGYMAITLEFTEYDFQ